MVDDRALFVEQREEGIPVVRREGRRQHVTARSRGNVHLSAGRVFGTYDGGPWELAFVTVGVTGPDGRATHTDTYEMSDMEVALRRFDELAAEPSGPG
jgi:hypothetical protein